MPATKCFLFLLFLTIINKSTLFLIPIQSSSRKNIDTIHLTSIGKFGIPRKARTTVPAHLHTGIDIKRPGTNYENEPIFPITKGKVISKRADGAFAQIIIEHQLENKKIWSLYEHIAGIKVNVNDLVEPNRAIARFMNKQELNKYGWQFDHFHLEIMKLPPEKLAPSKEHQDRHYNAYSLTCYTPSDLEKHYYQPLKFMEEHLIN